MTLSEWSYTCMVAAAVIYLTQATRDAPDDSAAMGLLARALWMAGRRDDARRALGAALSPRGVGFDESPFDGYTPRKAVKA